jgi:8-oxo-dGTP diphosphatase
MANLAHFIAFHEFPEAGPWHDGRRPVFAVVLARGPEGVLLVFNRYRRVWELPGGLIDAGETPREAAARELAEEAGAVANSLHWLGLAEVQDGGTHFGAVYHGRVISLVHTESDEVGGVSFWTPKEHPEPLGDTDAALLRRFGPESADHHEMRRNLSQGDYDSDGEI